MITIDFRKTYENGELIVAHDERGNVFPMLKNKRKNINQDAQCYYIWEFSLITSNIYTDEAVLESFQNEDLLKGNDYWDHP